MNKSWLAMGAGISCLLIIFYFQYVHPTRKLLTRTEAILDKLQSATNDGSRERVGYVLKDYISPTARIAMKVTFFSLSQKEQAPNELTFDKESFIRFVDNILYSMETYGFIGQLTKFDLNDEHNMSMSTIESTAWADGNNHYGGMAIMSRFSTNAKCDAQVNFLDGAPVIEQLSCDVPIRIVPKAEEAAKISQNPEALRDLILEVK